MYQDKETCLQKPSTVLEQLYMCLAISPTLMVESNEVKVTPEWRMVGILLGSTPTEHYDLTMCPSCHRHVFFMLSWGYQSGDSCSPCYGCSLGQEFLALQGTMKSLLSMRDGSKQSREQEGTLQAPWTWKGWDFLALPKLDIWAAEKHTWLRTRDLESHGGGRGLDEHGMDS